MFTLQPLSIVGRAGAAVVCGPTSHQGQAWAAEEPGDDGPWAGVLWGSEGRAGLPVPPGCWHQVCLHPEQRMSTTRVRAAGRARKFPWILANLQVCWRTPTIVVLPSWGWITLGRGCSLGHGKEREVSGDNLGCCIRGTMLLCDYCKKKKKKNHTSELHCCCTRLLCTSLPPILKSAL